MSVSAGLYEIRPIVSSSLALEIKSASQNNGANAVLNAITEENNQKFYLTSAGSGYWYITVAHSGKSLVVKEDIADNDCVWQWKPAASNQFKWSITETGNTHVIDGVVCKEVTIAPVLGSGLKLDCQEAMDDGNVRTCATKNTSPDLNYQRWVLKQSVKYYKDGPVPFDGGMSPLGSSEVYNVYDAVETMYPTFRVPSSWVSTNTYVWRWTARDMAPNGEWGDWYSCTDWNDQSTITEGYSAWSTLNQSQVTRVGDRVWINEGIHSAYSWSDCKHRQFYVQVCCCGTHTDGVAYYGPAYGFTLDICKRPTFYFTNAVMTAAGLALTFHSDYSLGSNRLTVIKTSKWSGNYVFEDLQDGDTVLLSYDEFGAYIEGTEFNMAWYVGNDQHAQHEGARDTSRYGTSGQPSKLIVSYTGGSLILAPTVQISAWGSLTVTVQGPGGNVISDAIVTVYTGGKLAKLGGENGVFNGFLTESECDIFVVAGDTTTWGAWHTTLRGLKFRACHLLCIEGKLVALTLRKDEPLSEEHSLSAIYEASALDARKHEAVRFAPTVKSSFTIQGAIVKAISTLTLQDVDSLVGGHGWYRSPTGRMCKVAVVGVSTSSHPRWYDVSISVIEETV